MTKKDLNTRITALEETLKIVHKINEKLSKELAEHKQWLAEALEEK